MQSDLDRSQLNDNNNSFPFHDPNTDTEDCNVAMTSQAVEIAIGETLTAAEIRAIGHTPEGPTGNHMTEKVLRGLGLEPVTQYQMLWKGNPIQNTRDLLRAGWFVVGYVDYGYMNSIGALTGDPKYTGIHAVGISHLWRQKGIGRMTHEADPLFDGRHAHTPKGAQQVPFIPIRDAAALFAGPGMWSGYAVKPKS